MTDIDFQAFDCDNHYYEATDAFTRHLDPRFAKRGMQWAQINGKTRLLVGGKICRFIPNPTFDPVSKPGQLDEFFRGRNPRGQGTVELFGELDPISPAYRDRDARLALMDDQGLAAALFLPTLGVGMEQALLPDTEAVVAAFRAFNRWMEEDWGFSYQERIFAAPYLTLVDPDAAVAEVEWMLDHDARFTVLVPGPVGTASGWRSPADPIFDPVWARINEAGITVAIHGGDSRYSAYLTEWGEGGAVESFRQSPFRTLGSSNPTQDTFGHFLATQMFHRFPNLRLAAVETGSDWVFHLHDKLKKSFGQTPHAYPEDPRETFRRHVWVSPFYEDELAALRQLLGSERILMGSDFPHAEGLADPVSYIKDLKNFDFSDADCCLIMRDNGYELSRRRPA